MEEKERKLPYRILGVYKPTILDADQIVRDLSTLLHNAGFPPNYITMRSPSWHEDKYNVNELRDVAWHRDINSNNAVGCGRISNVVQQKPYSNQNCRRSRNLESLPA